MKTSRKLLTGLALSTGLVGSACSTVPRPVAVTAVGADDACRYAASDPAPQIMVYDSSTGTETHVDANGTQSTMAVRNVASHRGGAIVGADSATHSDARSGYICTGQFGPQGVEPGRGGVNPVLVGAAAGAVTGALITKNGSGAAEGAVIGSSLVSTYADPRKGEDASIGAAAGAAVGAAATKGGKSTVAGAVVGAVLGGEAYDANHGGGGHHAASDDDE